MRIHGVDDEHQCGHHDHDHQSMDSTKRKKVYLRMNGRSVVKCKECFRRNVDREYLTEKDVLFLIKSALKLFAERHSVSGSNGVHSVHRRNHRVHRVAQSASNPLPSEQDAHRSELSVFRSHFKSSKPLVPNLQPRSRSAGNGTWTRTSSEYTMNAAMLSADGMDGNHEIDGNQNDVDSKSMHSLSLQSTCTTHLNHGDGVKNGVTREHADYFVPQQYQQSATNPIRTTSSPTTLSSLSRYPKHRESEHSASVQRLKDEISSLKRDYHSMLRDYNDLQLQRRPDNKHLLQIDRLQHENQAMDHTIYSLQNQLQCAQSDIGRFKSIIDRLNREMRAKEAVIHQMKYRNATNQETAGLHGLDGTHGDGMGSTDSMMDRNLVSSDGDGQSDDDELYVVDGDGLTTDTTR